MAVGSPQGANSVQPHKSPDDRPTLAEGSPLPSGEPDLPDDLIWESSREREEKSAIASSPPRPWIRYWAKLVDVWIIVIVLAVLAGMLFPRWTSETSDTIVGLVLLALAVPVQALLLSTWGTTFGKSLLGIKVTKDGRKLDFGGAFKRELGVYLVGFGLGIPIVAFFTQIAAYNHLKKEGASSWDQDPGNVVTHSDPSTIGIVAVVAILLLGAVLIGYGNSVSQGY